MTDPTVQVLQLAAGTLITNGHLTANTVHRVEALGRHLGQPVQCIVEWNTIALITPEGDHLASLRARPEATNMTRVSHALEAVDGALADPHPDVARLHAQLEAAGAQPASSTWLFVLACMSGACALAAIFGARHPTGYLLIALAAGLGGLARRLTARRSVGVTRQAVIAALIAGVVGGLGAHAGITSSARLVSVCPAMVLVPGPHLINGTLDIAERYLPVGISRLAYGLLTLVGIGGGLVVGLGLTGVSLPLTAPSASVPLAVDLLGAMVAAASYPVYFSMPLRQIGWPVLVGGAVHAVRWVAMSPSVGLSAIGADFITALLAGLLLGWVSHRHHLSFAGIGFAAIVALVPGMYVFRACAGLFALTLHPTQGDLLGLGIDVSTATLVLSAIALGLIVAHQLTQGLRAIR